MKCKKKKEKKAKKNKYKEKAHALSVYRIFKTATTKITISTLAPTTNKKKKKTTKVTLLAHIHIITSVYEFTYYIYICTFNIKSKWTDKQTDLQTYIYSHTINSLVLLSYSFIHIYSAEHAFISILIICCKFFGFSFIVDFFFFGKYKKE